jgi:hypothetical protein
VAGEVSCGFEGQNRRCSLPEGHPGVHRAPFGQQLFEDPQDGTEDDVTRIREDNEPCAYRIGGVPCSLTPGHSGLHFVDFDRTVPLWSPGEGRVEDLPRHPVFNDPMRGTLGDQVSPYLGGGPTAARRQSAVEVLGVVAVWLAQRARWHDQNKTGKRLAGKVRVSLTAWALRVAATEVEREREEMTRGRRN